MGFFRVKAGPDREIIVNSDCGVRVVLDFLRNKLGITGELDLCDEWGNLRFLTQAPLRCSCLLLVATRALYTPVVIQQMPALKFEFPMGRPALAHKTREAQRKVRQQWNKFQRLRGASSGRFTTDTEVAELIYQVVGCPSADFGKGKGKGKAHDPAPRSARPRSTSVGRKRKDSVAVDSFEEKENEVENGADRKERISKTPAVKIKKSVSIVDEQDRGQDEDVKTTGARKEGETSADTGPTDATETKQSEKHVIEVTEYPRAKMSLKQPEAGGSSRSEPRGEQEEGLADSPASKPNKSIDDGELTGYPKTPSGETAEKKLADTKKSDKAVDKAAETPEANVPVTENRMQLLPTERPINESTDSGIESAASRPHRPAKDREMRQLTGDGRSISAEAGSNEESTGESVLSQSTARLKHGGSLNMPVLTEQGKIAKISDIETAQEGIQECGKEENQGEVASGPPPSDAHNIEDEKTIPEEDGMLDKSNIEEAPDDNRATTPEVVTKLTDSEDTAMIISSHDVVASPTTKRQPKKLPKSKTPAEVAIEDIAGVTVSIMPPSAAGAHRRSINVTALLGIPMTDMTAEVRADGSTRKGIPSLIDEEWRKKAKAEQLIGVLSGTSKLVYLGSAKSASVKGPQIDVINTTEEEAERLGAKAVRLATAGPGEKPESAGGVQGSAPMSQLLEGLDLWKAPSSASKT